MSRSCASLALSLRSSLGLSLGLNLGLGRVLGLVLAASGGSLLLAPARAAPPTVTPSPGYDARLQEQRAASGTFYAPADPAPRPVVRHHTRRTHRSAH